MRVWAMAVSPIDDKIPETTSTHKRLGHPIGEFFELLNLAWHSRVFSLRLWWGHDQSGFIKTFFRPYPDSSPAWHSFCPSMRNNTIVLRQT
jgi:hypothetical protein